MSRVWRFLPAFVRRQVIRERAARCVMNDAALGVAASATLADLPAKDTTLIRR